MPGRPRQAVSGQLPSGTASNGRRVSAPQFKRWRRRLRGAGAPTVAAVVPPSEPPARARLAGAVRSRGAVGEKVGTGALEAAGAGLGLNSRRLKGEAVVFLGFSALVRWGRAGGSPRGWR